MPEIYINGRSSSHNSCLEIDEFGTSYVTSTGLLVTAESFNSTIAFSSPTNTLDSESSFCGIVQLIVVFFCVLRWSLWLVLQFASPREDKNQQLKENIDPSCHFKWRLYLLQCHLILTHTLIFSILTQFTTI